MALHPCGKHALVRRSFLTALLVAGCLLPQAPRAFASEYVIEISVDGLGSVYLQPMVACGELPSFQRFQTEGAWTNNARNDDNVTITLPNHTTMVTGRGVLGPDGHDWTKNSDPPKGMTLHVNRGSYLASVFDVAHDHGLRTGVYSGKTKFSLYAVSYDARNGAPDLSSPNHGRNKVDVYIYDKHLPSLVARFITAMREQPMNYSLVHFADTDTIGHLRGWGSEAYCQAIREADVQLGHIFDLVDNDPRLRGKTTIILSADHGGKDYNHANNLLPEVFTIPFYVWGSGAARGQDLYAINGATRRNPGWCRAWYTDPVQPVRNGDGANLALQLLGLGPVPGSTINMRQDLAIDSPVNLETYTRPASSRCRHHRRFALRR
jgi:predicted AlkP superfamily pyrophosphatase or phosphodiesterase